MVKPTGTPIEDALTHAAAEVTAGSDAYEEALRRNDVNSLNAAFLHSDEVVRFGIRDMQFGSVELLAWRAGAPAIDPRRRCLSRTVLALAPTVVAVDIVFRDGDEPLTGRQSQTWVRTADGWRIARAHVSVVAS
jgi:ketosteroid isomerase-like protein